jgi:hypothetical protein
MPKRKRQRLSNVFASRYASTCADCGEHIPWYTLVRFDYGDLVHADCRRVSVDLDAWTEAASRA